MSFKTSPAEFRVIELARLDPDPQHPRHGIDEPSLRGLTNAIEKVGIIQPLIVRPGANPGRYTVIAGERRRQAALLAGETAVPAVIRDCPPAECLNVQVFENLGLGVRTALEARDLASAIQRIVAGFETPEAAAQYFGRAGTWVAQATAPANLSEKVSALLAAGKIASTGAAVQIERLSKKDEARAESLIDHIEQLPEGEKVSKKHVDSVVAAASGRSRKKDVAPPETPPASPPAQPDDSPAASVPPWEDLPAAPNPPPARSKVNPGKVRLVAEILGLSDDDEEEILARLIDEFLAMKRNA